MKKNCAVSRNQSGYSAPPPHPPLQVTGTEKKRSFEQKPELTRFMIDHCSDAIFWLDQDGAIVHVNEQACRMLGYMREKILTMTIYDIDPNFQSDTWTDHWDVIGRSKVLRLESVHRTSDGGLIPVEISANCIDIEDKKLNCMFVRDLSRQRNIERKTREYEIRINRAQRMEALGTLAGGIAHDFNNILSSILGFSELSLDGVEPDTLIYDNIKEIFSAGIRARDLVKQILAFSRQTVQEKQPLQAKLIVKEALRLLRASIPATIKVRSNINSNGLILADPGQLHQIVMNLCTNASHAMQPNGGTLQVELKETELGPDYAESHPEVEPGRFIQLTVSDTGSGIAPDILPQIFEPFFTTKKQGEGTGMGLSVVHGIVREYGGSIHVASKVDEGATFTVYFPQLENLREAVLKTMNDLPAGQERILLVDDEPSVAKATALMLGRLGYKVTHCSDSIEAYEKFQFDPSQFDLIVTDYTMPSLPGDKLARLMMNIRPSIPIILCTGYNGNITATKAKELGIKAFLTKPVEKKILSETVRQTLDEAARLSGE